MKKSTMLPLTSIQTDRKLSDADNLDELTESIQKRGILCPVLIDEESRLLIDGLRRVAVYQNLGHAEIPAVYTNDFEELVKFQQKASSGPGWKTPTAQRVWNFYGDTERLRNKRTTALRSRTHQQRQVSVSSRELLRAAFPGFNEAMIAASLTIYKKFEEEKDPATRRYHAELHQKMETGELTIFQVRGRVVDAETRQLNGTVVKDTEQRSLLAAAIDQLSGTNSALTRLGEISPDLNPLELRAYLQAFENERRKLSHFIRPLRKRVTEK